MLALIEHGAAVADAKSAFSIWQSASERGAIFSMTDSDKTILNQLERETLALLERATFSIRDDDHAHAVRSDAQAALVALRPCLQRSPQSVVLAPAPVVVNRHVMRRAQDAARRLNVVIDSVTRWNGPGEAGVFRDVMRPARN
jgi:hypothetical protein